jgi:hypothetical protein
VAGFAAPPGGYIPVEGGAIEGLDLGQISELFGEIKKILEWIKQKLLSHLWAAIKAILTHIHDWYKWYQDHVQKPMRQAQQNFRKMYDEMIRPILKWVDLLRRITGLVGLFNKRLAGKLNAIFFRIESDLLLPLRLYTARVNTLSHMMGGFLTPLGFFDNATLLNSIWANVADTRAILRNPLGSTVSSNGLPTTPDFNDQIIAVSDYVSTGSGDVGARVDSGYDVFTELVQST